MSRVIRASRRRFLVGLLVFVGVVGIATIATSGLRWRARVLIMKARGGIPEIDWGDLVHMVGPGNPYQIATILETGNPYASVVNPLHDTASVAAGGRLFRGRCDQCHGLGAARSAPDLMRAPLVAGTSDWALYRIIERGIPGTGMYGQPTTSRERWQVISFIQAQRRRTALAAAPPPAKAELRVDARHLLEANRDSASWLMYSGSYDGHRFSRLMEVRPDNVAMLQLEWAFQLPGDAGIDTNEATPIVVGTVMYITVSPSQVWALDTRTGAPLWHYVRQLPAHLSLCCSEHTRGVAVLGDNVYFGTLDAHLVALNARTGNVVWDVPVADPTKGFSITSAPLALGDRIVTGVAGGEFGASGFIAAFDARTGKEIWRFHSVPLPGEPGNETWGDGSWKTGGAPTWLTGSYDPALNLIYWGVGNPGPNYAGSTRPGINLYTNSVVALDANTGRLRWFFQFTPHDEHDWDAAQIPILVDGPFRGRLRHLMLWANRNAFYYVLDRETGSWLLTTPFEQQTWADGISPTGQPIALPSASPTLEGSFVYPSVAGGTNWWSPSYSPRTNLLYVPTLHSGGTFFLDQGPQHGELFTGGTSTISLDLPHWTAVKAIDPQTGIIKWEYRTPPLPEHVAMGGLTSTAGGVLFGGAATTFFALDAVTGRERWHINTGGEVRAGPAVYMSGGHEHIAVVAGHVLLTFGLPQR